MECGREPALVRGCEEATQRLPAGHVATSGPYRGWGSGWGGGSGGGGGGGGDGKREGHVLVMAEERGEGRGEGRELAAAAGAFACSSAKSIAASAREAYVHLAPRKEYTLGRREA